HQFVPSVQKTDQQTVQYHLEMKSLSTLYSGGVISKTSLFVSLQNHSVLCLRTQLLFRFIIIFIPVSGFLWTFWQDASIQSVQSKHIGWTAVWRCWC
ncbi:hypothetical protein U0070_024113, partial [Myodes glareolus]